MATINVKVALQTGEHVIIPIEAEDAEQALAIWNKCDDEIRQQLDPICHGEQFEEGRSWDFVVEVV